MFMLQKSGLSYYEDYEVGIIINTELQFFNQSIKKVGCTLIYFAYYLQILKKYGIHHQRIKLFYSKIS